MKTFGFVALGVVVGAGLMFVAAPYLPKGAPEDPHAGHDHGAPAEEKEPPVQENEVELTAATATRIGLTVEQVELRTVSSLIRATGTIASNADLMSHVTPRIRGRVDTVQATLGQKVRKGDVLAVLDSVDLGVARAALLKAKAMLSAAQANFEREDRLLKKEATTEPDYLTAKAAHLMAEAEFRSSRETLLLYGLSAKEVDSLSWDHAEPIGKFPICAGIDGTIVEKHITVGEVIDTTDRIFTISDLSRVWLLVDVFRRDLAQIRIGQRVDVVLEGQGGRCEGRIVYIADAVRADTRTVEARVELVNDAHTLRPGSFASVSIEAGDPKAAVTAVSPEALQTMGETTFVFKKLEKADHYERVPVTVGRRSGPWVEILGGLAPGEEIVTQGSFILKSEMLRAQMGHGHEH